MNADVDGRRQFQINYSTDLLPCRSWNGVRTGPSPYVERRLTEAEFAALLEADA